MDKKNICLILFVALFASLLLFGCKNSLLKSEKEEDNQQIEQENVAENKGENDKQNEENVSDQINSEKINYSEIYAPVLNEYRNFTKDQKAGNMNDDKYAEEPWGYMNAMLSAVKNCSYGYAFKDLNGNGKDEMIILTKDFKDDAGHYNDGAYFINAIYSLVDNKPKLLEAFHYKSHCYIGKDGFIYIHDTDSLSTHTYEKCVISSDGTVIKPIETIISGFYDDETGEMGGRPKEDSSGEVVLTYYKSTENDEPIEINEQEFDKIVKEMPLFNEESVLNFIELK